MFPNPVLLASFERLSCPGYVNIHSIHKQTDRLFGTETLCGDYSGRLLILAQDFGTAQRIRDRKKANPNSNPFHHNPSAGTNLTLVSMLRHVGQLSKAGGFSRARKFLGIDIEGTSPADCGAVYGSIVWLLKDTKSVSSSLSNRQHVLRASRAAIEGAIQSMPNLDRIVCLGSVSYTGLARMHDLPNVWAPDLAARAHYRIKTDARLVEVYPTSHLGGLGLAQRAPTRTAALDACLDDFKRALA